MSPACKGPAIVLRRDARRSEESKVDDEGHAVVAQIRKVDAGTSRMMVIREQFGRDQRGTKQVFVRWELRLIQEPGKPVCEQSYAFQQCRGDYESGAARRQVRGTTGERAVCVCVSLASDWTGAIRPCVLLWFCEAITLRRWAITFRGSAKNLFPSACTQIKGTKLR